MEEPAATTLDCSFEDEEEIRSPTPEDLERVLARQPRDDDWFVTVTRPNDDCIDATILDGGGYCVAVEENGRSHSTKNAIDDATLKALFLSFLAGDDSWSRLCQWEE